MGGRLMSKVPGLFKWSSKLPSVQTQQFFRAQALYSKRSYPLLLGQGRGQGKFPFHAGGTDINDTRASPLLSGLHSMSPYGGLLSS